MENTHSRRLWEHENGFEEYFWRQVMQTSILTGKGQVTIPAGLRRRLNLSAGDRVGFEWVDGAVRLVKWENPVEAAFGLVRGDRSVFGEEMRQAIRERAGGVVDSAACICSSDFPSQWPSV